VAQQGDYSQKASLSDYTADGIAKLNDLVMFKALEGSGLRQVSLRAKVATELAYFSPEQPMAERRWTSARTSSAWEACLCGAHGPAAF